MAYSDSGVRCEFDLRVRKFRIEERDRYPTTTAISPDVKEEVVEDLSFKSLSALEVLRRLLDYLRSI